jgi:Flp pilus assembly protein TadG
VDKQGRCEGLKPIRNQRGATSVIIALCLVVFLGMGAMAVDLGHLYVVRNELQNAADAGALAGARFLYNDDGYVNEGANQIAIDAATANRSDRSPVEVNPGEVQRGHWSFATRTFTPNDSTAPVDLWDVSTAALDANLNFINAVKVVTRRQATQAASFFARIWGYQGFDVSAEAVAYKGFAGSLLPHEADQPVAICKQSLLINDAYTCSVGRMLNSGSNDATHNTAGWTNFSQPCETANASEMRNLICATGNPDMVDYGEGIGATGGVQNTTFSDMRDCWINHSDSNGDGNPDHHWELTLPVIDCPGNNVSNCATLLGAVTVIVVWMTDSGTPDWDDAPTQMDDWPAVADLLAIPDFDTNGEARWNSFVTHFNLRNADGQPAPFAKKSMYFLPDCTPHEPTGTSRGENFGVPAKIPVLVK